MTNEKQGVKAEVVAPKKKRTRSPNKVKQPITKVDEVVNEAPKQDEFVRASKNRGEATTYKVYLGGELQWFTKLQINIGLQRNLDIKIPEGSPFDVPESSRCSNCGG